MKTGIVKITVGNGTYILDYDHKPTGDLLCRLITGMSTQELAQDILRNEGGKYDMLYKKKDESMCQERNKK